MLSKERNSVSNCSTICTLKSNLEMGTDIESELYFSEGEEKRLQSTFLPEKVDPDFSSIIPLRN